MAGTLLYSEAYEVREEGRVEGWLEGQLNLLKDFVTQGIITQEMAAEQEKRIRKNAAAMVEPVTKYNAQ